MDSVTAALAGLVGGALIGFLFGRKSSSGAESGSSLDLARAEERLKAAESRSQLLEEKHAQTLQGIQTERGADRTQWRDEREKIEGDLARLRAAHAEQQAELEGQRATLKERTDSLGELKKTFEGQKAALKDEFKALSEKIYAEKQEALEARNRKSVGGLLEPLKEQIDLFRKRVDEVHKNDVELSGGLRQQLESLSKMNQSLQNEAGNLAKALRGEKKTLGNWGEVQVEKLLEFAGLKKDREYGREDNFKDGEGSNFRPDFVLYLPEGRHMIVDSKVSLGDYIYSVNADDRADSEAAMGRHVACVRKHINELSDKDYTKLENMKSPDFVFMFMPIETAYLAAFEADPSLFEEAYSKKIAVVTPNTLLPILRTVASLWQIDKQNQSTLKLADQAGKIHSKLAVFAETFKKVEQQLETALGSYQKAKNQLVDGRGNLVRLVDGFRDLGVKTTKALPADLVEESMSDAELLEAADEDGEVPAPALSGNESIEDPQEP